METTMRILYVRCTCMSKLTVFTVKVEWLSVFQRIESKLKVQQVANVESLSIFER